MSKITSFDYEKLIYSDNDVVIPPLLGSPGRSSAWANWDQLWPKPQTLNWTQKQLKSSHKRLKKFSG